MLKVAHFFVLFTAFFLLSSCSPSITQPPQDVPLVHAPQVDAGSFWEYQVNGTKKVYLYNRSGDPTSPYTLQIPFPLWPGKRWHERVSRWEEWTGEVLSVGSTMEIAGKTVEIVSLKLQQHGAGSGKLLIDGICSYAPALKAVVSCDFKYFDPIREGHGLTTKDKAEAYPRFRLLNYRVS